MKTIKLAISQEEMVKALGLPEGAIIGAASIDWNTDDSIVLTVVHPDLAPTVIRGTKQGLTLTDMQNARHSLKAYNEWREEWEREHKQ